MSETNLGKTTVNARPRGGGGAEQRQITKQAGVVAAGTLASRLLGLVRDQTIAAVFPRAVTDAFFVAFTIPNVLRQLLAEGAVQSAVLPVLSKTREAEGEDAAKRFFRATRGLSLSVLLVTSVLGVLLAPQLVDLFASGYEKLPGQTARTVQLTRWVFPYIFFMGTAALGVAALNTHQRFIATSFAPGLLNVSFIVCSLTLPAWLMASGWDGAMALAIAVLLGGVLQVVAQWPSLKAIGYFERPSFDFAQPGVREALGRMLPVMFGMGVYYVDVVLARRFLSQEGLGAQSYYGWALRLCDFPQGIFVMALQTAALPSLAKLAARGELGEVARTYSFGMRLTLFVSIAATALFVGLAEPLVTLLFQRGEFDAESAHETARALMAQGAGIWLVASVRQLTSTYYALGDTRTPVLVAAIDLCAFIGLALALRGPLGHVGIGLAVTGSSLVQAALLWSALRKKLPELRLREIAVSAGKTLLAAGAGVVAGRIGAAAASGNSGALGLALPGLVGSAAFILTFFALAWGLRSDELQLVAHPILRRLRKKPAA
ncbi:MAG TPA: murein biosynthesis integral membrane protein MurJ [Polyangiaceae bacterium]|nr:murein biosynthesis integral membrane protein MurJ [Polyangiaceae bacterium]